MLHEEQIITRCKKNERKAQKMLYDRYASCLLAMAMRYVYDKAEAEDILQESFLKIFTKIRQFEGKGSFEGWMKRIVVNTAIGNYRKNIKHYHHQDIEEVRETDFTEFIIYDTEFTGEELFGIIRELPEGYRMVFNLYTIEGYKHKEIADMLGIDIATSKSQFSRARKLIQKKLYELSRERVIA
ncbi:MAG: sigma-70 family RNA polymerase sigma factor [Bacteroidetes bacterium]|nr:sigma-70 family RNA polymerase sigma factor [Bacteroidota bacterium]